MPKTTRGRDNRGKTPWRYDLRGHLEAYARRIGLKGLGETPEQLRGAVEDDAVKRDLDHIGGREADRSIRDGAFETGIIEKAAVQAMDEQFCDEVEGSRFFSQSPALIGLEGPQRRALIHEKCLRAAHMVIAKAETAGTLAANAAAAKAAGQGEDGAKEVPEVVEGYAAIREALRMPDASKAGGRTDDALRKYLQLHQAPVTFGQGKPPFALKNELAAWWTHDVERRRTEGCKQRANEEVKKRLDSEEAVYSYGRTAAKVCPEIAGTVRRRA
jgi:hypothetical protein